MSSDFTTLPVLSDERLGAAVVGRNDEFFALADNLLKAEAPVFVADRYTKRGKWMDGWETRRRRTPGVDWCIVRLGAPGLVRGIIVDTSHFTGNFPKECWLEGCAVDGYPSADELADARWMPLGSRTPLTGDSKHLVRVSLGTRVTHVRLTISPDGGVARLKVHGEPVPDPRDVWGMPLDLAAMEHGAVVTDCSDMYFSHRHNLNLPTSPVSMADGWETRRRRGPGNDWVVVRLVQEGVVRIAEVDTRFFKGNAPGSFSLDGRSESSSSWQPLLGATGLQAHMRHRFRVPAHDPVTSVRLNIYPDGGVARLRLWGALSEVGAEMLGLRWLGTLAEDQAQEELLEVCGSSAWAQAMAAGRPYGSMDELREAAASAWRGLSRDDWLEAFAAHPRLGERPATAGWASQEQSGTSGAGSDVLAALQEGNREYEDRFGHVFLLCATGVDASGMLEALRGRIGNDPEAELRVAAAEQEKITELRLRKLLTP